jgi:hypothetical protein
MRILNRQVPADPLMAGAWYSALIWALNNERIIVLYNRETGRNLRGPPHHIDEGPNKGDDKHVVLFIDWFNKNMWGDLKMEAGRR